MTSKDSCTTICGDGLNKGAEVCDDSNQSNLDGCTNDCTAVEAGWTCTTADPSVCTDICGDSKNMVSSNTSYCDDGGVANLDGCTSTCGVETGWKCVGGGTSSKDVCTPICGNNMRMPGEACDDGNKVSGDGCLSDCSTVEAGWTCTGGTLTTGDVCTDVCGDGARVTS